MRSEFEKLPIIQEIMADEYDGLMFDERFSKYLCPSDGNEEYLNGAWMVWQQRQTEVDELKLQVAEMKSRLNDAYTDGQSAMYVARQSKVDELQKRIDGIKKIIREAYESDGNSSVEIVFDEVEQLEQALKGGEE